MPTIAQLPSANAASSADEVPLSQGGSARAISVGALLASTQPAIVVDSPSLLGRTSLGSGGPEQVDVGAGVNLASGTLVADGLDHAAYPVVPSLSIGSDLVVSNQGTPMLMPTSLLRDLFSAGRNVSIDPGGVISAMADGSSGSADIGGFSELRIVTGMAAQDLVAVSHGGSNCAITYSNLLGGVTIDQAKVAAPAGDSDTIWAAQGTNVMTCQTFGAIWTWIATKLPTYRPPVVEIITNTNLDAFVHNGRILVCSHPVTLSPTIANMGTGFQCVVINASNANITLGSSFISSSGSLVLAPWQSATLSCVTYSGGTIAFAAMPGSPLVTAPPGQVSGLSSSSTTTTTTTVSWLPPSTGGAVSSYIVQLRPTGTTPWTSSTPVVNTSTLQLTDLQPATNYDIAVEAQNATGIGAISAILTVMTASVSQPTAPLQVVDVTATSTSSSAIQINWSAQTGIGAPASFTVQYKPSGTSGWTSSVSGITGTGGTITRLNPATSYDFSVFGVNSAGTGPMSTVVTAATRSASASVSSIIWNLVPNGPYTHGSGTIGINALVSPAASPIQFGFSLSAATPPTSWTAAVLVNTNLWGAYAPTPLTTGSYYAWAAGLDGSALTVSANAFVVQ